MTSQPGSKAPQQGVPPAAPPKRSPHVEQQLDDALDASFPASDPVSIVTSQTEEDWGEEPSAPAPTRER